MKAFSFACVSIMKGRSEIDEERAGCFVVLIFVLGAFGTSGPAEAARDSGTAKAAFMLKRFQGFARIL